jgi:Ca-activated chloride channel family protein
MMCDGFVSRVFNASNFRQNISENYCPPKSSISIEGLFNEYYFDTGINTTTTTIELVTPSFAVSRVMDPLTNEKELYVTVGCNSVLDGKNYRNRLNLIVVLDISGSMYSPFNSRGKSYSSESNSSFNNQKQKIEVAVEVLQEIVKIMKPIERLGIVLFDDKTQILQPIREVKSIDLEVLQEKISEVRARGGTNMELGYTKALEIMTDMLSEEKDQVGCDSRILFLTDAMPNIGGGTNSLLALSKRAAQKNIYTSFIGVGLDFNTNLVDEITKVKGSNYFSVHSAKQFKKLLNDGFNYIVTPIAFNAVLFLESEAYQIDKVYGTPYDDQSDAIMKVDTVTASSKDTQGSKGGVILLKLKEKLTSKTDPSANIKLTLVYEERDGKKVRNTTEFDIEQRVAQLDSSSGNNVYENNGIRKAILLVKYVNIMHQIIDSVEHKNTLNNSDGYNNIYDHNDIDGNSGLKITKLMRNDLVEFISYFKKEINNINDSALNKELDVLDQFRYAMSDSGSN